MAEFDFDAVVVGAGAVGLASAYALWIGAVLHLIDVFRAKRGRAVRNSALALTCAVTLQAGIGIVTLLHQTPLPLALLHQIMGIVVLTVRPSRLASSAVIG